MEWDAVFSEAKARLDKESPIFWLVELDPDKKREVVRIGESSSYSGMYVDDEGFLQLSNPTFLPVDLKRRCTCCTHTFNGVVY